MGIKTVPHPSYSPDVAPCDFWLFLKLRDCRYETIEEMKEAMTKVIDTITQEDFDWAFKKLLERYNKVHCSWRRLLRRRLEFYVCTINKSAHTKKSGNLFNVPRIYVYIYIFIYIYIYNIYIYIGDRCRGRPECFLFNSDHTEVLGLVLHLSPGCSILHLIRNFKCRVLINHLKTCSIAKSKFRKTQVECMLYIWKYMHICIYIFIYMYI